MQSLSCRVATEYDVQHAFKKIVIIQFCKMSQTFIDFEIKQEYF